MLINKSGDIVANSSQIIVRFANETEYNSWVKDIDAADLNKFLIIKEYEYDKNNYIEVENETALTNLPAVQKVVGCLYGVKDKNKLYRYESTNNKFVPMETGSGIRYLHNISIIGVQGDIINVLLVGADDTPITTQTAFATLFKAKCGTGFVVCSGSYKAERVAYVQYENATSFPIYVVRADGPAASDDLFTFCGTATFKDTVLTA